MMNVIALWMLFSTLGAANVLFPEHSPIVKTSRVEHRQPLEEAKEAAKESLHHAVDAARHTGEGIRRTVISASHIPPKTVEALKHVGVDVAQVVKDGSQSGLEKIGLARPEEKPYSEVIKEEVGSAYHGAKDAAGETVEGTEDKFREAARAVHDGSVGLGERVQEVVKDTNRKVEDGGSAKKESVQERFNAAEAKASQAAGSAYEHTADCVKGSAETAKECTSSFRETFRHASEQAADIVKSRVAEAAAFLPNVGQGLAYHTHDTHDANTASDLIYSAGEQIDVEGKKEGFRKKVNNYVEGLKHTAGGYHEGAKEKASEAAETVRQTKDAAADGARDNAGKLLDIANSTKEEVNHRLNDGMVNTRDNLTQSTADGALTLKNRTVILFEKLRWISAAYFFSSCKAAHLFTFSSLYGSSLWVTFLSGYLLSRAMPRQQFGFVQSRIFPAYLRLAASGQAICLILYGILHHWSKADRDEKLQLLDLWAILVSTLANVFFLEPRATKAMFQKLKLEKEEGRGQDGLTGSEDDETKARLATIDNKFAAFHLYSSVANFLSLLGMTWHLWHLSRRLVV